MASRPQPAGGSYGVLAIVFAALAVTALTFLIILYMDQDELRQNAESLRAETEKLVSPAGRRLPQFAQANAGQGKTLADLLEAARARTAKAAVGDESQGPDAVETALRAQIERISADARIEDPSVFASASYDNALAAMYDLFRAEADARDEAQTGLDRLTNEIESMRETHSAALAKYENETGDLKEQVASIGQDKTRYGQERDAEIDDFEKQLDQIRQQCADDIQRQREVNQELENQYEQTLAQLQELKDKLGQSQIRPVSLATARQADGQILDSKPNDDIVYINLGESDRMTLGLEFAVYDALTGIPVDGQAKARIEVINVSSNISTCRVVERSGNGMIVTGDLIANPIYDRSRPLRFYVLGEFDLDRDGDDDPQGAELISALIKRWGGSVESQLSGKLDFVVLGGPPPTPRARLDTDPEDDPVYQQAQRRYAEFETQVDTIRSLAIPTLTQSVFLNFLGYQRSSVVALRSAIVPSAGG